MGGKAEWVDQMLDLLEEFNRLEDKNDSEVIRRRKVIDEMKRLVGMAGTIQMLVEGARRIKK